MRFTAVNLILSHWQVSYKFFWKTYIKHVKNRGNVIMNNEDLLNKWSEQTMEYGWVSIPSLLLFFQKELQISSLELNVIMNLVLHWWEKDKNPYPSQGAIARRMGVSVRTVQRTLDDLVEKELLERKRSSIDNPIYKGRNLYNLQPLVRKIKAIAEQKPTLSKVPDFKT